MLQVYLIDGTRETVWTSSQWTIDPTDVYYSLIQVSLLHMPMGPSIANLFGQFYTV